MQHVPAVNQMSETLLLLSYLFLKINYWNSNVELYEKIWIEKWADAQNMTLKLRIKIVIHAGVQFSLWWHL